MQVKHTQSWSVHDRNTNEKIEDFNVAIMVNEDLDKHERKAVAASCYGAALTVARKKYGDSFSAKYVLNQTGGM